MAAQLWALVWRDLWARLRDRSALVLGLLAPAALIAVFSLTAEGPTQSDLEVGFVSETASVVEAGNETPVALAIREGALSSLEAAGTVAVTDYGDRGALVAAIEDGDIGAGIVVTGNDPATVEVVQDSDAVVSGAILGAVADSSAAAVDGIGRALGAEMILGVESSSPEALQQRFQALTAEGEGAITIADAGDTADGAVGGIDLKTQLAAGMATFFLFFTVQFGVLGLLEEQRQGTLTRLLASPVPAWQILLAKLLVSFIVGVASMACLIAFSAILLGAEWGNLLGVAVLVVAGVLAAVSTITLVVGLAETPEQAGAIQSMLALVFGILGGSFFSLARSGGLASTISVLTPHFWFGEGLVQLSGGQSWTAALGPAGAMLIFAAAVGLPGLLLAGRTVRP
ncbi:MAG: ABC transporter permease [Acidimicrobiia bacterium]|nr:ABC transporter permease [Acidimicrobiia bacterium]